MMATLAKQEVIRAFGAAAQYYHQHATVQQRVARQLAGLLIEEPLPPRPNLLEIGCGTGYLSQRLLQHWPEGNFLLSDISWPMVQRCRANLGRTTKNVQYAVFDAEQPPLSANFDLITSSMVLQWFANPIESLVSLSSLLRPGGSMAFATLGNQTFQEWQSVCAAQGVASGLKSYPSKRAWQQGWQMCGHAVMHEEKVQVKHPSGLAFLRELKTIGAHRPLPGYYPQSAGILRRLLRQLDQGQGFTITYHLLYGMFTKIL